MRRILLPLTGVLLVGSGQTIFAQASARPTQALPAGNGEVRGVVVDAASGQPVGRASVAVRRKADAALVAGAIANAEGAFRISGLRNGAYVVRVTYIGFGPKAVDVAISDSAPVANVGTIKLAHVAVALEGVTVNEERAAVTVEPDRNAYRAKAVAPAATNASEILDAVPSVQVDVDGKVSLRGNENVVVQINGRPTPMTGVQLGAYLKALPASVIERVEVIPNPSARYDPEGMAGIINLVLKQNTDLGVSGGLNAGAAHSDRYNASGNLGYQSGPLTLFTSIGVNNDQRRVIGINDRTRFDVSQDPFSYTNQDVAGTTGNKGFNLTTTGDYRLTNRDVLTNSFTFNRRMGSDTSLSAYTELDGSGALLSNYDRFRVGNTSGTVIDYTSSIKRTFEARKHELSAEVRLNRSRDEDHTALWRQTAGLVGVPQLEGERDDADQVTKTFTAQVDYTRTLAARTKLESGLKSNGRWLDRDFAVLKDSLGTGNWVTGDLSNVLAFGERVQAAYGVLSQGVGKAELQAGLRAEYASRDFNLASSPQGYPYTYRSLFPSAVVLYNVSDATQLKASYSRRIRRPGIQELNPFPSFFDAQNVFIGNPNLAPEYTDAIELGWTRNMDFGMVQLSPFYRHTTNVMRFIVNTADTVEGREVTSVTFQNLARSNSWGTDLNGSLRLGRKLNAFAGFNVFKQVTEGGTLSTLGSGGVTWSSRVNATSEITPTLVLQGSYFYRAPMKIERGQFYAQQMANFSVRKKIDGDNASVSLRVVDPFNQGRFKVSAGDANIMQVTERSFGVRGVFLTMQYNYGQAPKIRVPRPEDNQPQAGFPQ